MTNNDGAPPTSNVSDARNDDMGDIEGSWLKRDTLEYSRSVYDLEMALAPLELRPSGISVWKVSNPTREASFKQMSKKKLHLSTWSDFTKKSSQELYSACQDGLTFDPKAGIIATNGLVPFDGNPKLGDTCIILMVDAIVGLSKVVDESKKYTISNLPPGYDSLSLQKNGGGDPNESDEMFSDTSSNPDVTHITSSSKDFLHKYQIFNEHALFPKYVMRFSLSSEDNKTGAPASENVDVYDRRDFFDLEEWRPVTLREKMLQSSLAPANRRDANLVTVTEAYKQTVNVSKMQDPKVTNAQRVIKNTLSSMDDKVRMVNMSFAAGEEKIIQAAKDAMEQLRKERDRKLNVLIATEGELRRKLQEIDFFEEHLVKMRSVASEVDYLRMWRSHTELRSDVFGDPNNPKGVIDKELKLIANVQPDMLVEGRLEVTSSDAHEMEKLGFKPKQGSGGGDSTAGDGSKGQDSAMGGIEVGLTDLNMLKPMGVKPGTGGGGVNSTFTASVMRPGVFAQKEHRMKTPKMEIAAREAAEELANKPPVPHSTIKPTPPPIYEEPPKPKVFVGAQDNIKLAKKVDRFRLSTMSARKQRLVAKEIEVQQMFGQSRILTSVDDARSLFFSLPGKSVSISTHLLFQGGDVAATADLAQPTIEDFSDSLLETDNPTVFILKSGDYIYGGYACTPWRDGMEKDTTFFGSPKSFLFSVTCDLKIPYMGRTLDVKKAEEAKGEGVELPHEALKLGENFISFGNNDLIIQDDLMECRSKLEESYGVGLEEEEAKTFLAGSNVFGIDAIEIFEIIQ